MTTSTLTAQQVELTAEGAAALEVFRAAKAAEQAAATLKAEAEAILRAEVGEAAMATIDGEPVLKVESRTRTGVDTKRLKAHHPEIAEAYATATDYTFLKVLY